MFILVSMEAKIVQKARFSMTQNTNHLEKRLVHSKDRGLSLREIARLFKKSHEAVRNSIKS